MEQIDDITECCICSEIFADPRMLPCIHTFCLQCLESTRSKSEQNTGDTMPCPICRQQFTIPPDGLSGLRKNFFMERLMEIAKISKPQKTKVSCDVCQINKDDADIEVPDASKYCVECQENMCDICSVQHKRYKVSRDHHIVPFGSQLKDDFMKTIVATYCSQHSKEELKMYCADCKEVICIMCFAENHQMHKCSDVNKVAYAFRDEIGIFQAKVIEGSKEALAQELKLEEEKRKFMEESEIAETAIKERANELKQLIDKHAKVLLDELVQIKSRRMKEAEFKHEEIKRYLAIVNSFNAYCSEMKSRGTPTDICRSVHDLRARANELQEVNATQIKQDMSIVSVSFKTNATDDILKVGNYVGSLEEQHKSLATLNTNMGQPDSVSFIESLQCPDHVEAVSKLVDKIYVLCRRKFSSTWITICIFVDRIPFQVYKNIEIREISSCRHIVSCDKLKCLYIFDSENRCIWKVTADDCRVTKWLPIIDQLITLSMSNDGLPLLLLTDYRWMNRLEIYGADAKIIRSISLSRAIMSPLHIIQESNGQFIILHRSDDSLGGSWAMSKLSSEGKILRQSQSSRELEEIMNPSQLFLDSENNRLFVTQKDGFEFYMVKFDLGSFDWKQLIIPLYSKVHSHACQFTVHYDERKKQLLVGQSDKVAVYQIH